MALCVYTYYLFVFFLSLYVSSDLHPNPNHSDNNELFNEIWNSFSQLYSIAVCSN